MSDTRFPGPLEEGDREPRLIKQHEAVLAIMLDGHARTLDELSQEVEKAGVRCPPASASAQLRHLRKPQFGGYVVKKKHRGSGLYEYWVESPRTQQKQLF